MGSPTDHGVDQGEDGSYVLVDHRAVWEVTELSRSMFVRISACVSTFSKVFASWGTWTAVPALMAATDKDALRQAQISPKNT